VRLFSMTRVPNQSKVKVSPLTTVVVPDLSGLAVGRNGALFLAYRDTEYSKLSVKQFRSGKWSDVGARPAIQGRQSLGEVVLAVEANSVEPYLGASDGNFGKHTVFNVFQAKAAKARRALQ